MDLKDAYYSVRVSPEHQKYLKFLWHGIVHKITCLPNGLAFCPRKFTEVKPVFSLLRQQGHVSSPYIDYSFLMGSNCIRNVPLMLLIQFTLLDNLGFVSYPKKSVFIPTQFLVLWGFVLNSIRMTVSLTLDMANKLKTVATQILSCKSWVSIREVAQILTSLPNQTQHN